MNIETAKRDAAKAGLELYFDRQWQSWGLIDPAMNVESIWISSADLRDMSRQTFGLHYVAAMQARIHPNAGGPFPIMEGEPAA